MLNMHLLNHLCLTHFKMKTVYDLYVGNPVFEYKATSLQH